MFTVLVCGGRNYHDRDKIHNTLYDLCDKKGLWSEQDGYGNKLPLGIRIVTGGADGADSHATDWAVINWAQFAVYQPDWKQYGLRAGPIRNAAMLENEKVDLVIGFPGGAGTRDMLSRARKAKIPVQEVK